MLLEFDDKDQTPESYPDDQNPINIYIQGNAETRSDVILNHPDVIGFVYLNENIVTKAFLPKKVINFKTSDPSKKKIIVAVSGDTDEFTPFSIPEQDLFSDTLHFSDSTKLEKETPSISIAKFLKDNADLLSELPSEFDSESKVKKLKAVAFPLILPLVRGHYVPEGNIDDNDFYKALGDVHDSFADWGFIHSNQYVITSDFMAKKCPVPDNACDIITYYKELPLKVLFKSKHDASGPYSIIKAEVNKFIIQNKKEDSKESTIPEEVHISEDKITVSSSASSTISSVTNERLSSFLAILFAKPQFDRNGDVTSLIPAVITDEVQEILTTCTKIAEQSRIINDGIEVLADDIKKERSYLSRASKFPFLSNTLITYAIQAHYHRGAMDSNMDSLKKSFSILSLLAPPQESTDEYNNFINSSKNNEVENMLEQPNEKRSSVKKDVFIKGRQENLNDVLSFISNIVIYTRFWVTMSPTDTEDQPYIIQLLVDIADYLSSAEFTSFYEKYKQMHLYMPHTLITYIFNIFSVFIKMAKNPHNVRKFKIENMISAKDLKIAGIMHSTLLQQLQLCSATSSLQNLFANPTSSFKIFCPTLYSKNQATTCELIQKKRPHNSIQDSSKDFSSKRKDHDSYDASNKKRDQGKGSIINTTGRKIWFPSGLEKKYCSAFLDVGETCNRGENCHFIHAIYPHGFTENDKVIMKKHLDNTEGLSCKACHKKVS